jgi:hypothetical protein
MTQGLSKLITNSHLRECGSSRGGQIKRRLRENEELIFHSETMFRDTGFHG